MEFKVPHAEYVGVEFPGVVENIDKAVEMLGGREEILNTIGCKSHRLKLCFRPHMAYAKPAWGDATHVTGLLLRVRRCRNKKTGEIKIMPTLLGRVNRLYKFEGMADYQYGPFERIPQCSAEAQDSSTFGENEKFRVFYEDLVIREPTATLDPYLSRDTPLYLPPLLFSRQDTPFAYNFAPRYKSSEYIKLEEKSQKLPVARKARPNYGCIVTLQDPSPMQPNPMAVERFMDRKLDTNRISLQMDQLFKERPVWLRNGLIQNVRCHPRTPTFKYSLPCKGYYMPQGPWGRSWIRFGYDPRADPEARFYQVIDFRLHSHVMIRKVLESGNTRRSGGFLADGGRRSRASLRDHQTWTGWTSEGTSMSTPRTASGTGFGADNTDLDVDRDSDALDEDEVTINDEGPLDAVSLQEYEYRFSPTHLPAAQQSMYCLVDVDVPEVQAILAEVPDRKEIDPVDGWLKSGALSAIPPQSPTTNSKEGFKNLESSIHFSWNEDLTHRPLISNSLSSFLNQQNSQQFDSISSAHTSNLPRTSELRSNTVVSYEQEPASQGPMAHNPLSTPDDLDIELWLSNPDAFRCVYISACANQKSGCCSIVSLTPPSGASKNLLAYGSSNAVCLAYSVELIEKSGSDQCPTGFRTIRVLNEHKNPVNCVRWLEPVRRTGVKTSWTHLLLLSVDSVGEAIIWAVNRETLFRKPWNVIGGDWYILLKFSACEHSTPNSVDGCVLPLPVTDAVENDSSENGKSLIVLDVAADAAVYNHLIELKETGPNYTGDLFLLEATGGVKSTVVCSCKSLCLCLRTFCWQFDSQDSPPQSAPWLHSVVIGMDDGSTVVQSEALRTNRIASDSREFSQSCSIPGHTNWTLCVDVCVDPCSPTLSVLVATGSEDSFIRLWAIRQTEPGMEEQTGKVSMKIADFQLPSSFCETSLEISVFSESVLAGHANWVTGVAWAPCFEGDSYPPALLSSSTDKSVIVWSPPPSPSARGGGCGDEVALWLEAARMGNFGGTSFGFRDCFWSATAADTVYGHNFHGSISVWRHSKGSSVWTPGLPVTGHYGHVNDLSWSSSPSEVATKPKQFHLLLTAGVDQTVRAHVPLTRYTDPTNSSESSQSASCMWQELARPQIHGYNMNAVASLSAISYVSAGCEKVVRVFKTTRPFVEAYKQATGLDHYPMAESSSNCRAEYSVDTLAEGAVQPTLGLSNQIVAPNTAADGQLRCQPENDCAPNDQEGRNFTSNPSKVPLATEDYLQNSTLWPEVKKLYGHTDEVFCLAAHPNLCLVASAGIARTAAQAYIILWNGYADWAIHQRLTHHQLTVVQMSWSNGGEHLLAVSRDRTWSLWSRTQTSEQLPQFSLTAYPTKGASHSRIIWTCAWSPDDRFFLTGSRDKTILIWSVPDNPTSQETTSVACRPLNVHKHFPCAVTALDMRSLAASEARPVATYLTAVGLESGELFLLILTQGSPEDAYSFIWSRVISIPSAWSHALGKRVTRVAFEKEDKQLPAASPIYLATASEDGMVHVFTIDRKSLSHTLPCLRAL
ncbi:unnamed protein product [Calicophoron daubneyi]|uniref:Elongator complex protein 2 n=1 Tax=Calicophoron daubneyi TaxID=300641 RepID=A0AAV2TPX1_CALDB